MHHPYIPLSFLQVQHFFSHTFAAVMAYQMPGGSRLKASMLLSPQRGEALLHVVALQPVCFMQTDLHARAWQHHLQGLSPYIMSSHLTFLSSKMGKASVTRCFASECVRDLQNMKQTQPFMHYGWQRGVRRPSVEEQHVSHSTDGALRRQSHTASASKDTRRRFRMATLRWGRQSRP